MHLHINIGEVRQNGLELMSDLGWLVTLNLECKRNTLSYMTSYWTYVTITKDFD